MMVSCGKYFILMKNQREIPEGIQINKQYAKIAWKHNASVNTTNQLQ